MKIKEDIHSITYLKSRAAQLLAQINQTHRPVIITQKGEARAVIQDPESFEQMRYVLGLMKLIAQGEEDIRSGHVIGQDALFKKLRKRLKRGTTYVEAA